MSTMKRNSWRYKNAEVKKPLRYAACGLDDVYLLSGYDYEDTPHGKGLTIKNIDGLHRAIGCYLATHKKDLNGKELRFLRKQMDLTQPELGKLVGVTDQQVARWEKEQCQIPNPAETLVRILFLEEVKNSRFQVREILELLDEVEDVHNNKHEFINTTQGWQPKRAA